MSVCTGIAECGPSEYCDLHFQQEARLWRAFFGEDTPENAADRKRFLEDHQVLMSTQVEESNVMEDWQ